MRSDPAALFLWKEPPGRALSEPGGTRWRTGGEVKGKLAIGVGSQYSHATSEPGLSSITQADAHTSAASSRLNWRPHRFKWSRPLRGKTKSGFCACAITFRTSYRKLCDPQNWSWIDGGRRYSFRQGQTNWRVSRAIAQGPKTINGAISHSTNRKCDVRKLRFSQAQQFIR